MLNIKFCIITFIIVLFCSCTSTHLHTYKIKVVDENNQPIKNIKIGCEYNLSILGNYQIDTIITNDEGVSQKIIEVPISLFGEGKAYFSSLNYYIDKDNYYLIAGYIANSTWDGHNDKLYGETSKEITLSPIYYKYQLTVNTADINDINNVKIRYKKISGDKQSDEICVYQNKIYDSIQVKLMNDFDNHNSGSILKAYVTAPGYKPFVYIYKNILNEKVSAHEKSKLLHTEDITLNKLDHIYQFIIRNHRDEPIQNANIRYTINDGKTITGPFLGNTNSDGKFVVSVCPVFQDWSDTKLIAPTDIQYSITKFGYDTINGKAKSYFGDIDIQDLEYKVIYEKLNLQSKEKLAELKWDKTYNGFHFAKIPSENNFFEEAINISITKDSTNNSDSLNRYVVNETSRYLRDIFDIYPNYENIMKNLLYKNLVGSINLIFCLNIIYAYDEIYPEKPEPKLILACGELELLTLYNDNENKQRSLNRIDSLLQKANVLYSGKNILTLNKLAEISFLKNNGINTKYFLDQASELSSNDSYNNYLYGLYYLKDLNSTKAREYLIKSMENRTNLYSSNLVPKIFNELYTLCTENEDYTGAFEIIEKYGSLLNDQSDIDDLLRRKGFLYFKIGNYKEAINYLNKYNKVNKSNGHSYIILALISINQKKYQEAINYLSQGERIDPENGKLHYLKAMIYYDNNECQKAKKEIEIANSMDVEDSDNLEENINKKCNPIDYIDASVSQLYFCQNNWGYDETCVNKVDIKFENNSLKTIKRIAIELEIKHGNNVLFRNKFWMNVNIQPEDVLSYPQYLNNNITAYGISNASELNYNITILEIQ